ncbi:hypothetical protein BMS3Abin17_01116 [archaeon BMS3Abin17]|nr:hypothetical protein BMS3Abin17_01116 [archaeon BMS3Abin17]
MKYRIKPRKLKEGLDELMKLQINTLKDLSSRELPQPETFNQGLQEYKTYRRIAFEYINVNKYGNIVKGIIKDFGERETRRIFDKAGFER